MNHWASSPRIPPPSNAPPTTSLHGKVKPQVLCHSVPNILVSNAPRLGKPEVPHLPSSTSGEATQTFRQHIANRHLATLKVTTRFSTRTSELVPDTLSCSGKGQMTASCLHPQAHANAHTSTSQTVPIQGPTLCQALCPESLPSVSGLLMVSCLNCPSF